MTVDNGLGEVQYQGAELVKGVVGLLEIHKERIPKAKVAKNPLLFLHQCIFTMHIPGVHGIIVINK